MESVLGNALSRADLTGTAKTSAPQRVRPVADAGEKETKLDAASATAGETERELQ